MQVKQVATINFYDLQGNCFMTAASSLSIAQPSLQGPAAWAEYMEERTVIPCDFYIVTSATSDFLKSW